MIPDLNMVFDETRTHMTILNVIQRVETLEAYYEDHWANENSLFNSVKSIYRDLKKKI